MTGEVEVCVVGLPWAVLAALGNYGGEEIIDAVEPYFSAENEQVRSAAYTSLRRIDDPKAMETLFYHYETEEASYVKIAAMNAVKDMPISKETNEFAVRKLINSGNDDIQQEALVNKLGEGLKKYPKNEDVLRQFLQRDLPIHV